MADKHPNQKALSSYSPNNSTTNHHPQKQQKRLIFTALVTLMILRSDAPDLLQSLFILATIGLLNIYIFTIGKDIIQFAFFFAVYVVLLLPIENSLVKILASAGILYYESTFFRAYYILIAITPEFLRKLVEGLR